MIENYPWNFPNPAVRIRNACVSYIPGTLIIDHLNLTVPRESIYALVGSSGCGKSTILSCVLGLIGIDSGEISVFGNPPDRMESLRPGTKVGCMPQDLALYEFLTIRETFQYFGRLYGMSAAQIQKQDEFMVNALGLPDHNRSISSLSGGQRRLASLAVSLIHEPQLLILDEPTVGLDPLLRHSIQSDVGDIQTAEPDSLGISEQSEIPYPKQETGPSRTIMYRENIRRSFRRVLALTIRNYCNMCRTPIFIIGLIVLPTIHIVLTALTIGQDPKEFSVGVVNHEYLDWETSCNGTMATCGSNLSCMFLDSLAKQDGFFDLVPVQSEHEALEKVKRGEMWGYISIPENYTSSIVSRVMLDHFPDNTTLEGSIINLKLDMSQYLAGLFIIKNAYESFESYIMESVDACGGNVREMELPLNVSIPVYGSVDSSYMEYIIPGVLLLSLFVIMLTFTAVCVITDKKQKTFDRSRVAGVTTLDIMISHLITDGTVVIFQAGLGTLILIFGFNLQVQGSIILFLLLLVVSGFYGHVSGLLFGALCQDEIEALFLAIFAYLPMLMLSGVLWPLQAMHPILRQFTYCLPLTLACESLRSIISRGLGVSHIMVWPGIAILVGWALIFWFGAWFMFRRMNKVKLQKVPD